MSTYYHLLNRYFKLWLEDHLSETIAFAFCLLLYRLGVVAHPLKMVLLFFVAGGLIYNAIHWRGFYHSFRTAFFQGRLAGAGLFKVDGDGDFVMNFPKSGTEPGDQLATLSDAHKKHLEELCDRVYSGNYTQAVIDLIQEEVEDVVFGSETTVVQVGVMSYRIGLLKELVNPALTNDYKLLTDLDQAFNVWYDVCDGKTTW